MAYQLSSLSVDARSSSINCLAFSADGKFFFSGSEDGTLKPWGFQNDGFGQESKKFSVESVAISKDGKLVCSTSENNIKLWNMQGTLLSTMEGHTESVRGVAFSPDGKLICSGSWDNTVRLWRVLTGETIKISARKYPKFNPGKALKEIVAKAKLKK